MRDRHVVVLSGAGISAESGLATFRGAGGLWEGVPVSQVATPEGWRNDVGRVLRFYNERRIAVRKAEPNAAHRALKELEEIFSVTIITQNIDDLHERAGSSKVIHLHGEILKARSSRDETMITECLGNIELGDRAADGSQLRPHVVWFGEAVPMMERAIEAAKSADFFIVVGTSLEVYPAASLIDYVPYESPKFIVDPMPSGLADESFHVVQSSASEGIPRVVSQLKAMMA
jgi:NAD-dependent deacetylase